MKPASTMRKALQKSQQGFTIVAAIFILVVLAGLGGFIMSVSTNQQIGSALDVQGARAYEAARSGLEWGLYRQLQANSCATSSSFTPAPATLSGLTVTVTCTATADAGGGPTSYRVSSVACNQANGGVCPNTVSPGANYVERRLEVDF